jgi:hypothetical protein
MQNSKEKWIHGKNQYECALQDTDCFDQLNWDCSKCVVARRYQQKLNLKQRDKPCEYCHHGIMKLFRVRGHSTRTERNYAQLLCSFCGKSLFLGKYNE